MPVAVCNEEHLIPLFVVEASTGGSNNKVELQRRAVHCSGLFRKELAPARSARRALFFAFRVVRPTGRLRLDDVGIGPTTDIAFAAGALHIAY